MLGIWQQREIFEAKAKDQLIARLKEHGAVLDDDVEAFKCDAIAYYRKDLQAKGRHPMMIRDKRRRQQEIKDTFDKISLYYFTPTVVNRIESHVPNGRRIQVYEKVFEGISESDSFGSRNKPVCNPRGIPETPFSVSKAAPGSVKSNAELIDSLALATNMEAGDTVGIRSHITFLDSMNNEGLSGGMRGSVGLVSGGRLNRDHMLSDVPNHYVRDRLMAYINGELEESKRDAARAAVFPDLTPSEVEQYSALIAKKREEDELEVTKANQPLDKESKERIRQTRAMQSIDHEIDLTPRPGLHTRNYNRLSAPKIRRSVITPNVAHAGAAQLALDIGTDIDLDCDQVRAMIKRFTCEGEWYIDEFRWALGAVSRATMISFLEMRGPEKGKRSVVYELAWEFLRTRERLGFPIEWSDVYPPCNSSDGSSEDEGSDAGDNRGTKRSGSGEDREASTTRKRARTRKTAA
ncbi:hypothetical protein F4810DRAFT_664019 [Camillea tinctor]|nr:hypothetical protein F4810DRAFT_664019 [Camillea tinctor]